MSEPPIKMKANFIPYSDGSGHQVSVTIEQEYEGADPTISIETAYRFEISAWPTVRNGIERMLKALP